MSIMTIMQKAELVYSNPDYSSQSPHEAHSSESLQSNAVMGTVLWLKDSN